MFFSFLFRDLCYNKNGQYRFWLLDERTPVTYPDVAEDDEGNIYVTYDFGRFKEREFLMAKITEADIPVGEVITQMSFLKRVANRATGAQSFC